MSKENVPKTLGTTSQTLIAYHANCIDGFTSAWVTYNALTNSGEMCELIAMEYNPKSERALLAAVSGGDYTELYVVDFSLELDVLRQLRSRAPGTKIIILDHHKTAFERYFPGIELTKTTKMHDTIHGASILLDNGRSGAGLVWEYFHHHTSRSGAPKPWIIKYVQDYDLWKFSYGEDTKYVNRYFRSFSKTIANWDRIHTRLSSPVLRKEILYAGQRIHEVHMEDVNATADMGEDIILPGGEKGLVTECDLDLMSDVGHILAKRSRTFGAMYHIDIPGNKIKWSLRSEGDYDVSALAKQFGGGGHKNAAGFEAPLLAKAAGVIRNA